jgi:hypothetical protein
LELIGKQRSGPSAAAPHIEHAAPTKLDRSHQLADKTDRSGIQVVVAGVNSGFIARADADITVIEKDSRIAGFRLSQASRYAVVEFPDVFLDRGAGILFSGAPESFGDSESDDSTSLPFVSFDQMSVDLLSRSPAR